jgi:hypothetical protein
MGEGQGLIPTYTFSDIQKVAKKGKLQDLKSCFITYNGVPFLLINPQTDYIKLSAENLGQLSNSVRGESLEDILKLEGVA